MCLLPHSAHCLHDILNLTLLFKCVNWILSFECLHDILNLIFSFKHSGKCSFMWYTLPTREEDINRVFSKMMVLFVPKLRMCHAAHTFWIKECSFSRYHVFTWYKNFGTRVKSKPFLGNDALSILLTQLKLGDNRGVGFLLFPVGTALTKRGSGNWVLAFLVKLYSAFPLKIFLFIDLKNWTVIALQCCIQFSCATTWVSCRYTCICSPLSLPPTPLGQPRALSWAPVP